VCLLEILRELAPRLDLSLAVLHLNHQMRGAESDADEEYVRELAARSALPFHSMRADVPRIAADTGDNLEQAARRVRRDFFIGFLKQGALERIALGHTRSDQAETVLFRVLRGSGLAGLAGIRPVTPDGLVRPLIGIDRAEVRQYLSGRGIAWREDSSNADCRFARNRIRHELLPGLARDWNPALPETLARMAAVARDEEEYWEAEIGRLCEGHLIEQPPAVLFRTDWFRSLPPAIARRAIRYAIRTAKGDLRDLDMEHVERILELMAPPEGSGRLQVPGLDVYKSLDWVRLAPPGMDNLANRDFDLPAPAPGLVQLPNGGPTLSLELVPLSPSGTAYNEGGTELDWDRVAGGLRVRNWRPGDRYRPVGRVSETKIKLMFQDARIPLWERRRWPIITCGESIVWAARFGTAADFAATPQSRTGLRVRELDEVAETHSARHSAPPQGGRFV
jgi:tRNA(Ile)-lysidine synthase